MVFSSKIYSTAKDSISGIGLNISWVFLRTALRSRVAGGEEESNTLDRLIMLKDMDWAHATI
jgi:hypothetical protein